MKVIITINCDNDAFQPDPDYEVARILAEIGRRLKDYCLKHLSASSLLDVNGNTVGNIQIEGE